jgi:hypothetical protein
MHTKRLALLMGACLSLAVTVPALAQSNNDDSTPLNSRIKRDRQYPTENPAKVVPTNKLNKVELAQSQEMGRVFSRCLYTRSRSGAIELLGKTDFGFVNFAQIGMQPQQAAQTYGFQDCLRRATMVYGESVVLPYNAVSLRSWLLQAAYFDRNPNGPTWIRQGYVTAPRTYPLSQNDPRIQASMAFADCVVATDPNRADRFFRTAEGTAEQQQAIADLTPALSSCLTQGQQVELSPVILHAWLGEALWHASVDSVPAPQTAAAATH